MGITKILIISILFWVAFKVYTDLKSRAKTANDKKLNQKIIACNFCKTYVPIASAIKVNQKYFCCLDHSKNA